MSIYISGSYVSGAQTMNSTDALERQLELLERQLERLTSEDEQDETTEAQIKQLESRIGQLSMRISTMSRQEQSTGNVNTESGTQGNSGTSGSGAGTPGRTAAGTDAQAAGVIWSVSGEKPAQADPYDEDGDGIADGSEECETCKNRKYQDGSDEMVSFKSPAHVAPQASGSAVRAHEQEHVANAYRKAGMNNGKVLQASVQIHMSICPECGRSYVSGGTTTTQIAYYNEDNPYQQDLKIQDADKYSGMVVDTWS